MAAAAVAETVALRARPEPGSQPGGPLLLRTPAEPSPALAGRGSLLPGKRAWSAARAGRAWAWGALSARARGTRQWAPVPWPVRPGSREVRCAPEARSGVGYPWRPRARGAGSGPPGPRDRFVYKHCRARAAARGGTRGGAGPRVGAEELCEKPGK